MAPMEDDLKKHSLPEIPLKEIINRLKKTRQQKSKIEDDNRVSKYFLKHTHNYDNKQALYLLTRLQRTTWLNFQEIIYTILIRPYSSQNVTDEQLVSSDK
jgi:hypothetical protein